MRARFVSLLRNRSKSAIFWARQWRALRGVVMNRIKLSIRVPAAQETMLRHIAELRGLTRYQALARVIETGLGAIMHGPVPSPNGSGDDAFASLDSRLSVIEALTDRSLFTASAAYAYARRAALRNDSDADKSDSATSEAAQASYKRQRALAAEALS
jgi:D-serine deaminase-like pyridoxal phosphate-dependent protein